MGEQDSKSKEIINEAKTKIVKGSYKDRYKNEIKDPKEFYDMNLDIDSFSRRPEIIWKIQTNSRKNNNEEQNFEMLKNKKDNNQLIPDQMIEVPLEEKQEQKQPKEEVDIDNFTEDDCLVLGIVGLGNVGKSYLLSLFINQELPSGESIHTKGISVKIINDAKKLIILDSEGVEAPLTKSNISKDLYPKDGDLLNKDINESDSLIQTLAKDKKTVELFIQDFIIDKSSILFIVVGQITFTEQKLINRIVNETNKKTIFVIHNLKNFYNKEQINNYIENTFKKNIFLNFETFSEQTYDKGIQDNVGNIEEFGKYFLEKYKINEHLEKEVVHFIMGSNVKESEAFYFNKTVVEYVRKEISSINGGIKFNIIEELKQYVLKKAQKYVELKDNDATKPPFLEEDIKLEKEGDTISLKIKNEANLKKCLINPLGFSSFYGSLYSPNYICYIDENVNENVKENEEEKEKEKGKKFVVEINLCGKEKENFEVNTPKREEITEDGQKTLIIITGTKKLREYKNMEVLDDNTSTMDSGNWKIHIVLDNSKYKIKQNSKVKKEKKKGFFRLIYFLENKENSANSEMMALNFNFSEKK
jgi:hypothetical protein